MSQTKKVGKYHIILKQQLGRGTFAKTYKAYKDRDKKLIYACKVINKSQIKSICLNTQYLINRVQQEFKVLKNLKHNNIIRFQDSQQTTNNLYLFFQCCQNGTLKDFIQKHKFQHDQKTEINIIKQIIEGCYYLQQKGVVHRDIKPQNILLKGQIIKIADFGLAKILDQDDSYRVTVVGTYSYMAPQILKQSKTKQTKKCDVWSVGITIYQLITGYLPFQMTQKMKSQFVILSRLQKAQLQKQQFNQIKNPMIRTLIMKMLVIDTKNRITFKQARQLLINYQ